VAERFFNTLKTEFISQQTYATRAQALGVSSQTPSLMQKQANLITILHNSHQTTVQILIPHKR
jgi:hypothetical protein